VVIALEQYAARIVSPASQRTYRTQSARKRPRSQSTPQARRATPSPVAEAARSRRGTCNKQAKAALRIQRRATSDPTADTGPFQKESAGGRAVGANADDVDRVDVNKPDGPAGRVAIIDEGFAGRAGRRAAPPETVSTGGHHED
jgi:hypothetical protein